MGHLDVGEADGVDAVKPQNLAAFREVVVRLKRVWVCVEAVEDPVFRQFVGVVDLAVLLEVGGGGDGNKDHSASRQQDAVIELGLSGKAQQVGLAVEEILHVRRRNHVEALPGKLLGIFQNEFRRKVDVAVAEHEANRHLLVVLQVAVIGFDVLLFLEHPAGGLKDGFGIVRHGDGTDVAVKELSPELALQLGELSGGGRILNAEVRRRILQRARLAQ